MIEADKPIPSSVYVFAPIAFWARVSFQDNFDELAPTTIAPIGWIEGYAHANKDGIDNLNAVLGDCGISRVEVLSALYKKDGMIMIYATLGVVVSGNEEARKIPGFQPFFHEVDWHYPFNTDTQDWSPRAINADSSTTSTSS